MVMLNPARIEQFEMALRMQASASDTFDISQKTREVHELCGTEPGRESFDIFRNPQVVTSTDLALSLA